MNTSTKSLCEFHGYGAPLCDDMDYLVLPDGSVYDRLGKCFVEQETNYNGEQYIHIYTRNKGLARYTIRSLINKYYPHTVAPKNTPIKKIDTFTKISSDKESLKSNSSDSELSEKEEDSSDSDSSDEDSSDSNSSDEDDSESSTEAESDEFSSDESDSD